MPLFETDDQRSIEEKLKHIHRALEGFFANNRCTDPEDCAAETLRRALDAAAHQEIAHPYAYIWNTARLVLLESIRRSHRSKREVPIEEGTVATGDNTDQIILLKEVLAALAPQDAALLRSSFIKNRAQLAKEQGITVQQLNFRLYTIRSKLRETLGKSPRERA